MAEQHLQNYTPEKKALRAKKHLQEYTPEKKAERAAYYQRKKRHEAVILDNEYKRVQKYEAEIQFGLSFVCVCCERILFHRSVFAVRPKLIQRLEESNLSHCVNLEEKYRFHGDLHICKSDYKCLTKAKKMPDQCFSNNLKVPIPPPALQGLTRCELQLLSKNLLFVKYRQLPVTRMTKINDRVICVPIEDGDVIKSVNKLPRNKDNNGLVWVMYKRQKESKSHYLSEMISPQRIHEALHALKEHHPAYKNVEIDDFDILEDLFDKDNEAVSDDESDEGVAEICINEASELEKEAKEYEDHIFNSVTL